MGSEPEVMRDKAAMRLWSRSRRSQGKTVALVPTMGFLHDGHLALIRTAHPLADLTVVSIYVNPGQFAPSEDFSTYPSDLTGDLKKLADLGIVHAVFCPSNLYDYEGGFSEMSTADRVSSAVSCIEAEDDGSGHETWIRVEKLERGLCGKSRPVFFRGVATVVAKLFNIVEPDVAIFGKKDYQQWRVICRMVRDLDYAIKIVGSEIVRESDGLAMSSRNVRLSPEERVKALSIYNSMSKAKYTALHEQTTCQEIKDIVIQMVDKAGGRIDCVEMKMTPTVPRPEPPAFHIVVLTYFLMFNFLQFCIPSSGCVQILFFSTILLLQRTDPGTSFSVLGFVQAHYGSTDSSASAPSSIILHLQQQCKLVKLLLVEALRSDYVVEQESLVAVEDIRTPVVICVAAWFGKVRLIDNMEINPCGI
ncbi:hypothetical protein ZIOFF_051146 [Zingiber officinale]|uniref:Pantoate--beta-alanine ligase n=1 Tax=Zingiber officinale TaxID=94328 RepID=A0A8J5FJZ9_ZINOF|nr:hypothetical protein ZIOFF_051146 [Zingiber officinale]